MNQITFTVCRAKNIKPETLDAIGEMVKVAIENLRKIEMRAYCKGCDQIKPIMKKVGLCNSCFLAKHNLGKQPEQPPRPKLKAIVQPPPTKAA